MGYISNILDAVRGKAVTSPNSPMPNVPEQQVPPSHIPSIPLMSIPDMEQLISSMYTSMGVLGYIPKYLYRDVANSYTSWVYTVVQKIAFTIACAPKLVYTYNTEGSKKILSGTNIAAIEQKMKSFKKKSEKIRYLKSVNVEKTEVLEHPIVDLLARPNKIDVDSVFWMEIVQRMELAGACGIYKKRNGLKTPSELWVLPTSENGTFKPIPDPVQVIAGYFYSDGNIQERFLFDDVIWPHYPNPRNKFEGMSALLAQIYPYNVDKYLLQHQYNFFQNNGFLGATLETEKELSPTQVGALRTQWNQNYAGAANAGKPFFAHSGLKVGKSLANSAKEVLGGDTDTVLRDRMFASYGMSESMVGLTEHQNKANADTARENYLAECVVPRWHLLKDFLDRGLCAEFDDRLCLDIELPEFEQRDIDIKENESDLKNLVCTINEIRQRKGMNSVSYGDGVFVPINMQWEKDPSKIAPGNRPSPSSPGQTPPVEPGSISEETPTRSIEPVLAPGANKPIPEPKEMNSNRLNKPNFGVSGSFAIKFLSFEKKQAIWKTFVKNAAACEPMFQKAMQQVFQRQAKEVIDNLEREGVKVKSNIAGWGRQKVRTWLAEHKDKIKKINFDKNEWIEKTTKALTPAYNETLQIAGQARMDEYSTEKAKAEFNINFASTAKWKGSKLREVSKQITGTTFDQVELILQNGFEENESLGTISTKLRESFDQSEVGRAGNIARTEATRTYNRGDLEGVRQMHLESKLLKFWITGSNPRDTHVEAGDNYDESNAIDIDEDFKVGDDSMDAPGDGDLPEEVCNCFTPDTLFSSPLPKMIFRSVYNGEIITVQTASGHKLSGTPNHPILTSQGFIPLQFIEKGQSVFTSNICKRPHFSDFDVKNRPTGFEQVFDTFSKMWPIVRLARIDMHLYGKRPQSDVDVICVDSELLNRIKPFVKQIGKDFFFSQADFRKRNLFGFSLGDRGNKKKVSRLIPQNDMGILSEFESFLATCLTHSQKGGFAHGSCSDSHFGESGYDSLSINFEDEGKLVNRFSSIKQFDHPFGVNYSTLTSPSKHFNTVTAEMPIQCLDVNAALCSYLSKFFSSQIFSDEIINIHGSSYDGFVYTAHADNNIYNSNGIVVKNCNCTLVYVKAINEE
jgi:hypothetical protein